MWLLHTVGDVGSTSVDLLCCDCVGTTRFVLDTNPFRRGCFVFVGDRSRKLLVLVRKHVCKGAAGKGAAGGTGVIAAVYCSLGVLRMMENT